MGDQSIKSNSASELSNPLLCRCCGAALGDHAAIVGPDRVLSVAGQFSIIECEQCGAGTTQPFVPDDEIAALYEGDYQNHDADVQQTDAQGLMARLHALYRERVIMRSAPLDSLQSGKGRLLDVGCGNAVFTQMIAEAGWDVVGIEPDPQICDIARKKIGDVRVGNIKTAELEAGQFDVVLFNHTLEHVAFPVLDLKRAYELLRPGGQLLVAVPHYGNWQRKVFGNKWLMLELPRHRTHFTAQGLKIAVERAGFVVTRQKFGTALGLIPASIVIAFTGSTKAGKGRIIGPLVTVASLLLAVPVFVFNKLTHDGEVITLAAERRP